ncbi:hypothetical protein CYMTET_24541, partial [Cymbomonas tetramitiformis]
CSTHRVVRVVRPCGPGVRPEGWTARSPRAIILEPARDLAEQTAKCIVEFGKYLQPAIHSVLLVGGMDSGAQSRACRDGVDVVTGTPARIIDFAESGKLDLSKVRFFVLDEADRLLDTGSLDSIMKLYRLFPKQQQGSSRLQVLMFSATLHAPEIKELSEKLCSHPTWVDLKGKDSVPETVHHAVALVSAKTDRAWNQIEPRPRTDNIHVFDNPSPSNNSPESLSEGVKYLKFQMLRRLIDTYKMDQCIIFCRTNFDVDNLEDFFVKLGGGGAYRGKAESGKENPYSCVALAGGRPMEERRRNLQAFKEGDIRFMICTDVAARGLDIKELPYVINMTLPDRSEDYIHRVGRVGRADVMGLAISIVAEEKEKVWYCSKKGYKPWLNPQRGDVKTNDQGGHTIWYDEMEMLKEVETRLGAPVERVGASLTISTAPSGEASGSAVIYGQAKGGGHSKVASEHMEELRPNIAALAALEVQAQTSFFALQKTLGCK